MIACYLRISTGQQKTDSQRADIERWLRGHKIRLKDVTWFEDVETGMTLQRPGFEAMQQSIFNGEVEMLAVWKLDRISRSQKDGITLLADWCERGVRVVSVTQQLDLDGSVGRLIAGVLFGIAEIEREHLRERQAAGIAAAREKSVYKGRKAGTTKSKPERAWDMHDQGLNKTEIGRALGVHPQTVWRYLKMRPKQPKTMKVELWLQVENNSKFVRGKGRSREEIEDEVLSRYSMEKPHKDSWEYTLTISYETDEELDRIIYEDILGEAHRIADWRNGFIEASVQSLDDPDRGW